MAGRAYIHVVFAAALGVAIISVAVMVGQGPAPAVAALGSGIPDEGKLSLITHQKLDEVNANLREINAKLGELVELLNSGKLEVVAHEKPSRPAPEARAGGGPEGQGQ